MRSTAWFVGSCLVVLAAVALCSPMMTTSVQAWGSLGHYMVGAIAQGFLSPAAERGMQQLLPESDGLMGPVASWADSFARDAFRWSPPLHYADTPDWACSYFRNRDCYDTGYPGQQYCVDGAIQNFSTQLVEGRAPLSENVAAKFLIHFVGDIHQPLHVGFRGDAGGNTISGTFQKQHNRKLHQVWDEDMLDKRLREDFGRDNSTYVDYFMSRLSPGGDLHPEIGSWLSCPGSDSGRSSIAPLGACSDAWASESIALACSTAYVDEEGRKIANGFDLQDAYYHFALPVAERQLAKAGIRLAKIINNHFDKQQAPAHSPPLDQRTRPQRPIKKLLEL